MVSIGVRCADCGRARRHRFRSHTVLGEAGPRDPPRQRRPRRRMPPPAGRDSVRPLRRPDRERGDGTGVHPRAVSRRHPTAPVHQGVGRRRAVSGRGGRRSRIREAATKPRPSFEATTLLARIVVAEAEASARSEICLPCMCGAEGQPPGGEPDRALIGSCGRIGTRHIAASRPLEDGISGVARTACPGVWPARCHVGCRHLARMAAGTAVSSQSTTWSVVHPRSAVSCTQTPSPQRVSSTSVAVSIVRPWPSAPRAAVSSMTRR